MQQDSKDDLVRTLIGDVDNLCREIIANALEGILIVDASMQIVMVNQQCGEILGYKVEELLGERLDIVIPEDSLKRHKLHTTNYIKASSPKPLKKRPELLARRKDGALLPVRISLYTIQLNQGEYVVANIIDLRNKKQTEQALRESEELVEGILESAVDGIITINQRGIIQSINSAGAKLMGYTPEEAIGQNINIMMPEPYTSEHDNYLSNYIKTSEKKIIGIGREVIGRKKDGTVFPFYLSVSEFRQDGQRYFAGIIHDLTEQKAAEKQLKSYSEELEQRVSARTEALAKAVEGLEREIHERKQVEIELVKSQKETQEALQKEQQLNELKSRFVSMASHEFRTPLSTILTSLNLLEKYQAPEHESRRSKHFNRIKNNVRNLTSILNDFLSLSKLEEGQVSYTPSSFDLDEYLTDLVEEFQELAKTGQKLNYTHDGEKEMNTDKSLLRNVMNNLISNAMKYSPEGSTIHVRATNVDQKVKIEVQDEGMGIREEEQALIFDRFFRASNATYIQGTGLGLSIVKRYVDLMQGEVSLTSTLGEGTTFTVVIPQSNQTKSE